MFRSFPGACVALVIATPTIAKPIAFADGTTVMAEYGAGTMQELQIFYAPRFDYSVGGGHVDFTSDIDGHTEHITYARLNRLAHRWNLDAAQANVFAWGGAGSATGNRYTGSQIAESERQWALLVRHEARGRLRRLLPPGTILCLPTTPFPAPKRGEPLSVASAQRDRILCLCAHGGLAGMPQVSLPGATIDGLPVGLSIVGGPGSDTALVAVAGAMAGG